MRKIVVMLVAFFLHTSLHAQLYKADSVTAIIEKTGNTDQKAGLLIYRSKAWPNANMDKSMADVQQALAYYQQNKNEEGQVDAYLQLSGLYSRQNKYKLALDIDSVTYVLGKKIGYKKGIALALGNMGRNQQQAGDMQKAKTALIESRQMMMEAGMERETAEILNRLGTLYRKLSDFKTSLKNFDEGLEIAKKYNNTVAMANIYMNKANTLNECAQYDQAISMHLESIRIKEKLKDERGLAQSYNNLGAVYTNTGQYKEALHYFELTKSISEKTGINNKTSLALAYSNLASAFSKLHQYDSVEYYYNKSLLLFQETGEKPGLALVYDDMGNYYMDINQYAKALDYLQKALVLRKGSNLVYDEASTRNSIGVVLSKLNRPKEAEEYLLQSLALVRNDGSKIQQDIYRSLATHYRQVGNFEKASEYQGKYISIKDTLISETEAVNMVKAQSAYEIEKKEIQLALADKEKQLGSMELSNRNKTIWLLVAGLVSLALLLSFVMYSFIQKRKAAAELAVKNNRIETLIRELHHRVKNNLQVVSGLLSLQSNRIEDDAARQAMDEGRTRVDAMAMIHQKLYMDKDLAGVDIKDYLENLTTSLAGSFGYGKKHIETSVDLLHAAMDIDKAIPIGLIVNELVTNAFKHAFSTTMQPKINVSLAGNAHGVMELKIADNGSGVFEGAAASKSFGMKLVATLVQQLNGTMQQEHNNGTIYNIQIRA
ncbi:tetratricopeptide repeat protein [Ferruginibacter profundus]